MELSAEYIKEQLKVNQDLLTMKESTDYPGLYVIKYKKKVFFEGLWNEFLEECRGLVVDKNFNIVSRPFKKIYNYGVEKEAPLLPLSTRVIATEKINGFMVAATYHNGELIVSTTGSLDSGFAEMGLYHLENAPKILDLMSTHPEHTFMFECCDSSDPHIIDEKEGLYFLGARHKDTGVMSPTMLWIQNNDDFCKRNGINRVKIFETTIEELEALVYNSKIEGYVFYTPEGVSAKIKTPYYLTKKMLMRKNMSKLMSMDAKEFLDEEFYPLVDYIKEVDSDYYFKLDELAKREYIENWFSQRTVNESSS